MALDDSYLYWTDRFAGTLSRVPRGGGTPETIISGQDIPYALVLDGAHLFWTNSSSGRDNGTLMRAERDGKDVKTIVRNLYYPQGLAVNQSHFFLVESRNGINGRVLQIPR
jgi:sugar lactone lactonase YvrE